MSSSVRSGTFRSLLRSADLRRVLPGLMFSALLSNLLALALPLAILQILDRVVKNQAMATLVFIAIGVTVALLLGELLHTLNGAVTSWLGARFEHRTMLDIMARLFKVPMRRYAQDEPGAYAEKLQSTSRVAEFYSGQALLVMFDLPFTLLFLLLIYLIGNWIVLVPVALLILFSILVLLYGRSIGNQMQDRHISDDRRFSFLYEVLSGIHSVKTMMMERSMERRYERLKEANAGQGEKLAHSNNLANGLGILFSQAMIACVVFAGSIAVIDGEITPGSLAACMMLSVRSMAPLRRALSVWVRYQGFLAANQRLGDLKSLPVSDSDDKPEMPPVRQSIELKDIYLAYTQDQPLFSGLSLNIKAGECVAIRGESGSGKSSLLSLLSGMEVPDQGEVSIDGVPLDHYSAESVNHRIALLPQTGTVVTGTILENLTMFDASLNARAIEVSQSLGLDRFVAGMKLGYETPLGENNQAGFPEGVRQLLTIARALVQDPQVILFDEANISLDMDADRVLREYLEQRKGEVTLILVTHRPSLVKLADRTYTLKDGTLIQGEPGRYLQQDESDTGSSRPQTVHGAERIITERFQQDTDLSNCLYPLLHQLGWDGWERDLAESLPHMDPQLDLSGFVSVMSNFDYQPRHLGYLNETPDSRLFPCLFLPSDGGARVLLERLKDGRLRLFNGETNSEEVVNIHKGDGDYYVFTKIQPQAGGLRPGSWIREQIWRFRKHLLLILLITFFTTLLALAPPLFVMSVYDWVLPAEDIEIGLYLLAGVGLAILLSGILTYLRSQMLSYIAGRFEYILGVTVFQRIINLPAASIEGVPVSRQVGRIRNLERLRDFFLGPMASLAFDLPAVLVIVIALALINPWILIVLLISALCFIALGFIMQGMHGRHTELAEQESAKRWEFINETLNAMPIIRASGAESNWMSRLREMSGKASVSSFKEHYFQMRYAYYAQLLGSLTGLTSMIVSAVLASKGMITSGVLIASLIMTWRLVGPILNVFLAATSLPQLKNNIRQLENLMRLNREQDGGVRQVIRPDIRGNISFGRVSFRYANDADPVLLGISLNVPAKHMVAITGPDGAGKSTLLKMVLRVYTPQAGTIRMDDIDIRQMSTADLRTQISYMPQNFQVFYGTVSQNLRLVHPAATDEELHWAADMAGLLDDVNAMPEGFETRISNSRSAQLPNGFRQRLNLARAILKPASVVLMDEPGTGMDQAGDAALVRCLNWLRGRATVIIVTPRPGHLRLADHVVYLQKGSIAAMGPFEKIEEKVMKGLG